MGTLRTASIVLKTTAEVKRKQIDGRNHEQDDMMGMTSMVLNFDDAEDRRAKTSSL